jgi:peptidoglycan/xylan/chitin deacetylase (PgdA/CDA1 family)
MYHSVSREGTDRFIKFTLSPEVFTEHMEYISNQGYTPITVAEYARMVSVSQSTLPDKPIIITFDDGFADFYYATLPILEKFHFSASLYVVTNDMGGTSKWLKPEGEENRKMLTWSQLSEIWKAGIECGTHSHTHLHLDTAKPEVAYQEIFRSKDILEQKLGSQVYSLAYPYGHYTRNVRRLVIEAGYTAACAVRHAMSHTGDDLFGLARITINRQTNVARLSNLLSGKGLSLAQPYEFPWVTGWRQIRRVGQLFSQLSQ